MTPQQAKSIIDALLNEADPATSEFADNQAIAINPELIAALNLASEALVLLARRKDRLSTLPENVGKPWSEDEDKELIKAFQDGQPVKALATKHKRTQGAITARLSRLGQLPYYGEISAQSD